MVSRTSISFPYNGHTHRLNFSLNCGGKFRNSNDAQKWFGNYLLIFINQHPEIKIRQIQKITKYGVILRSGRIVPHPKLLSGTDSVRISFWKTLPLLSKFFLVDPNQKVLAEGEPPEAERQIAKADFEFLDPKKNPHLLDMIPFKTRWRSLNPHLSKQSLIDLETEYLVKQAKQSGKSPGKKKQIETRFGVGLGVDQRRNYRMTIKLEKLLQKFFRVRSFTSDEIFAKNSPLNGANSEDGLISGAITSSFNRLADTVTLMRKVEAENGSSDCYAGRIDTESKAKEMAEFIFLGEIDAFEKQTGLSKGIRLLDDGSYQFTFAVQSLLSMSRLLSRDQRRKYFEEVKAYRKLIRQTQTTPLEIKHPRTGKTYRVQINPHLPMASNQFNFINRIEFAGFGKSSAQAESQKGDHQLAQLADQKISELKGRNPDRVERIKEALKSLQNTHLKPWQIVMIRSYLCHLLDIPQVVHCLSSVDRTGGAAIPMITAMKQWLRSKRPIPASITDIVNTTLELPDHSVIYPFKHLFYYKMLHELKVTEFSRGRKGFKLDEVGPLHLVHQACRDLLPEYCFKRGRLKDSWAFQEKNVHHRRLIF